MTLTLSDIGSIAAVFAALVSPIIALVIRHFSKTSATLAEITGETKLNARCHDQFKEDLKDIKSICRDHNSRLGSVEVSMARMSGRDAHDHNNRSH